MPNPFLRWWASASSPDWGVRLGVDFGSMGVRMGLARLGYWSEEVLDEWRVRGMREVRFAVVL
jgi:hypothetical protein